MPTSEKALIRQIRRLAQGKSALSQGARSSCALDASGTGGSRVVLGIGDDAAVLQVPAGHEVLITTDFSLEGVHFRRDWHPADSVGHRCLARGLSDIAAMGGTPVAAFLSLALPAKLPQRWLDGFLRGLLALARQHGVLLAGGDTAQAPGRAGACILADIVVVGSVPRGKAIRRSGAGVGDVIYVTGALGASAAVLDRLYLKEKKGFIAKKPSEHFYPQPRIAVGQYLRAKRIATAMIDLSDGLSTDLHHICKESRLAATVYADRLPVAKGASLDQALHGGEDYELLFTAPAAHTIPKLIEGVPVSRIGELRRGSAGVTLVDYSRGDSRRDFGLRTALRARGWEHFASLSGRRKR